MLSGLSSVKPWVAGSVITQTLVTNMFALSGCSPCTRPAELGETQSAPEHPPNRLHSNYMNSYISRYAVFERNLCWLGVLQQTALPERERESAHVYFSRVTGSPRRLNALSSLFRSWGCNNPYLYVLHGGPVRALVHFLHLRERPQNASLAIKSK